MNPRRLRRGRDRNDEYLAALRALSAIDAHADIMQTTVTAAQKTLRAVWNNHYAGVVARDGADAITMENYARPKERKWNILNTFNDLYLQFAEFRRHVRSQGTTLQPTILKSQDDARLKALIISAAADSTNIASRLHGRRLELQRALQSVSQEADEFVDASMLHFRMYGPGRGQTFHEQFSGSTANPVTMTLSGSLSSTLDYERQETNTVCNACIAALSLHTPDPAINAALNQEANSVAQVRQDRLAALGAAATIQDVMRVRQRLLLRGAYNGSVERVRTEAAAIAAAPGLFNHPNDIVQLGRDLVVAIQANPIGRNPRGRDARMQVKRALQALKLVADGLEDIKIHE